MIKITENEMKRLHNKWLAKNLVLGIVLGALMCWAIYTSDFGIAMVLLTVTAILAFAVISRGGGLRLLDALLQLKDDYISDKAVGRLTELMGKSKNFAERISVTLLLCDVYRYRGEIDRALQLINTVERERFFQYPSSGMNFYSCVMDIYDSVGDSESVLAAYRDGSAFIDECALRNINCCCIAARCFIDLQKAMGNYRAALEMQLLLNRFSSENGFSRQVSELGTANIKNSSYSDFLAGLELYRTAELALLVGNTPRAAEYIDRAGPVISRSSFYLEKANALSAKIRDTNSGGLKNER